MDHELFPRYGFWIFLLLTPLQLSSAQSSGLFRHHTVNGNLPSGSGQRYGTPAMADFDNDGDLDFMISETNDTVYLFELLSTGQWLTHTVAHIPTGQLGGVALDVDRDGWTDVVAGGHWFRNNGQPGSPDFKCITYDSAIDREIHDLVVADVDGDGKDDLVALGDKEGCFWYAIPEDPSLNPLWKKHLITMEVLDDQADIHGGFFPAGVGDLDMDGDADVILVGRWYRNEGKGLQWTRQFLPFGSAGYWGLSGRSWIIDLDGDGDNDVIMGGCDQVDSRVAWLENNGSATPGFTVHLLPLEAEGRRGSFHSLWVEDFDLDGDADIFTMEQEDHQILPTEAPIRAFLWENMGGNKPEFKERIVLDKNIGGHDVLFGDADGDGDTDAYLKVWSALTSNAYGGKAHVDYLENLTR